MNLAEIAKILEAEVIVGGDLLNEEIKMGCGSDLMSDVLSFVKSEALLLTGLINPQVVRTAEMADLAAICFVRGKKPGQETIRLARTKNIPLLTTPLPMFESCGRLWQEGLVGCSEYKK
ncbi:MAG TPA: DRTGG domain-containing protein [Sedimentisphaerales bacterium]|nr:DRTGG domain-containing protein [Sedimentisphaerales bacterium]